MRDSTRLSSRCKRTMALASAVITSGLCVLLNPAEGFSDFAPGGHVNSQIDQASPKGDVDSHEQVNGAFGLTSSQIVTLQLDAAVGMPLVMPIPIDGQPRTLRMVPNSVRAASYRLRAQVADGSLAEVPAGASRTMRGDVMEAPGSIAAGSLFNDGLHAVIRMPDGDRVIVEPVASRVKGAAADQYVVYHNRDVIPCGGTCGTVNADWQAPQANDGGIAGGNIFCVEIGCDADFEYFLDHNSSVSDVQEQIELIINTVNLQYETECDIRHVITEIIVRTAEPDPYSSTSAGTLLNQFEVEWNANQQGVPYDVAHLFTGKNLNGTTIGIANLSEICTNSSYSLVQSDWAFNLECKTDLSSHELGHNWAATHCSCPAFTMNPSITCANQHEPGSITQIVNYRNSRPCLEICEDGAAMLPFFDDFPSTTIDSFKWTGIEGVESNGLALAEPSAPNSANLDGSAQGGDELRSAVLNSDGLDALKLDYFYEQGGGGDDPEANEDLVVEYIASNNQWTEVKRHFGNGPAMIAFAAITVNFPANAMHDGFRVRFRAISSNAGSDDWFVDNVSITGGVAPANNTCFNAPVAVEGSHPFDTTWASTDGPDELSTCSFNGSTQITNDVWFLYPAQCDGTATVSLCGANFNSKVAVYGSNCPGGVSGLTLACGDSFCGDDPQVSFPVVSGQLYRIRVGGVNGAVGAGTMVISCAPDVQPCPADVNNSGNVNVDDLLVVINNWGALGNNPADVNDDNIVDVDDLVEVINAWGACP